MMQFSVGTTHSNNLVLIETEFEAKHYLSHLIRRPPIIIRLGHHQVLLRFAAEDFQVLAGQWGYV